MTETASTPPRRLPHLEYVGDPTASLRVPELRVANATLSRTLGRQVDVMHAITAPTADRWDALAHIAWLIHKRQDPQAQLGLWTNATAGELSDALEMRPTPEQPEPEDAEDPEPPTLEEVEEQAAKDPTETTD